MSCIICGHEEHTHLFNKDGFELVTCTNCKLVYVLNQPTTQELARFYAENSSYHAHYLDPNYDFYEQFAKATKDLNYLESIVNINKGQLLEIGCSAGFFLKVAQDHGWQVQGVELNYRTAAVARNRFGLQVKTGTLEGSSFPDESFDVVALWDLIEHVPDPRALLNHIRPLLKPGGTIILRTPNIDGLFPKLSAFVKDILHFWPHPEPPGHLVQFSKNTITQLLVKAGFTITAIQHEHIPLSYSFGTVVDMIKSPKRLLYALAFIPSAWIGPSIGKGDSLVVVAKRNG